MLNSKRYPNDLLGRFSPVLVARASTLAQVASKWYTCLYLTSDLYSHTILSTLHPRHTTETSSRRDLFQKGASLAAGAAMAVGPAAANAYSLPDLPYPFEALEPYIDAPTMKIHHDKHHATYVAGINKWAEGKDEVPILDLMADALEAGAPVRNSGGGHYNHAFFWTEMAPPDDAKKTKVSEQLEGLINKSFGSMDEMKAQFEARAAPAALFGSGWVWVCVNQAGDELKLVGTPNQDNPLMKGVLDEVMFPILGLDVWEHAYYRK